MLSKTDFQKKKLDSVNFLFGVWVGVIGSILADAIINILRTLSTPISKDMSLDFWMVGISIVLLYICYLKFNESNGVPDYVQYDLNYTLKAKIKWSEFIHELFSKTEYHLFEGKKKFVQRKWRGELGQWITKKFAKFERLCIETDDEKFGFYQIRDEKSKGKIEIILEVSDSGRRCEKAIEKALTDMDEKYFKEKGLVYVKAFAATTFLNPKLQGKIIEEQMKDELIPSTDSRSKKK